MDHAETLNAAGFEPAELSGGTHPVHSPIDGTEIAHIAATSPADVQEVISRAQTAFRAWRDCQRPDGVSWFVCSVKNCVPRKWHSVRW